ncbi:MAG TPA: phage tail protein [Methylomirabilota bacterium]|nr:phage tail protein [Methylomirabilota bacterium]
MDVRVTVDTRDLERAFDALGAEAPRAVARAMNRTIATVKTAAVRASAAVLTLPQKDVRPAFFESRATSTRLEADLRASGKRIPLIAFGARGPEPSRGRGRGVTYRLPGGRGRGTVPSGFIATMRSGHRGVFKRTSNLYPPARRGPKPNRAWLPIRELFGPSIPRVLLEGREGDALRTLAAEALVTNLEHEVAFLVERRAAGSEPSVEVA